MNPWQGWTIVSAFRADKGQMQTCVNCGVGILNVGVATNKKGEIVYLGMDCAERVGLDASAVKEVLKEKFGNRLRYEWRKKADDEWKANHAAELAAEEARREAATVEGWALTDLDGNFVPAKIIKAKYGLAWMLFDKFGGEPTGVFVTAHPEWPSTLKKKGYREVMAVWHIAGPERKPWPDTSRAPIGLAPAKINEEN